MKRKIHPIEQEVNEIRLRIYEETKNMTPEQKNEYYRRGTEATIKKYNLKVVASAKDL